MDEWKKWGKRLREHIREKNMNLAKLAEKLELSEATLRSWTNSTRKINLEDFFLLCRTADLDPAVILFGMPIMSQEQRQNMGKLAISILEADPTTAPGYKGLAQGLQRAVMARKKREVI